VLDLILHSSGIFAYLTVFALLLAGALGLPVPEDLALIAAGVLIHLDQAHYLIMGAVCYIGIIIGDTIIYRIGYMTGPTLFRKRWFRRLVTSSRLHSIRSGLERRTFSTIFVARHLFYLRTASFLICGAVRLDFKRFLVCDLIAALITTPLMLFLGCLFGEHVNEILEWIERTKIVLAVGGVVVAVVLVTRWRRRRKMSGESIESNSDADIDEEA
jgi:membrane protein DedA with SNARE-associated domain